MPEAGDYEVRILIDGQYAHEFEPVDEDLDRIENLMTVKTTRYIESIKGSKFSIEIRVLPNTEFRTGYKASDVYIDGRWVAGFWFDGRRSVSRSKGFKKLCNSAKTFTNNQWMLHHFEFKDIATTDQNCSPLEM